MDREEVNPQPSSMLHVQCCPFIRLLSHRRLFPCVINKSYLTNLCSVSRTWNFGLGFAHNNMVGRVSSFCTQRCEVSLHAASQCPRYELCVYFFMIIFFWARFFFN